MGLDITIEIIAHEVIVAVVGDGVAESGKPAGVAEGVGFDGIENAR